MFGTVKIIAERDGDNIVISVADTGCGIAEEDQNRVFEKFYRGRPLSISSVTANSNGTSADTCLAVDKVPGIGLGLYLVKTLIHQMNGRIELKSAVIDGRGTTFAVVLPISKEDNPDRPSPIP